jgi:alpha-tubulin suppressor-like RCC1 family protein
MVVVMLLPVVVAPIGAGGSSAGAAPSEGTVGSAKLAVGGSHACVLSADGTVRCWGLNSSGQLGNNSLVNAKGPVRVGGFLSLSDVTAIAAGTFHSCALLADGTVRCWGLNSSGQLGNNSLVNAKVPVLVHGLSGATAVAAGARHSCALVVGGTVQCWGQNDYGQLGNNSLANSEVPVAVSGLSGVTAIAVGEYHSCALLVGGTVKCWGLNTSGQLGNNSFLNAKVPVLVSGVTNARAIALGARHSCALLVGGTVQCWGLNSSGQLGNNSLANAKVPVLVSGLSGVTAIAGGTSHSCALVVGGTVECWGLNTSGQLGAVSVKPKTSSPVTKVPVQVSNLTGVTAIGAGTQYSCALLVDGSAQCWGLNSSGQLGNSSLTNANAPVPVSGISGGTGITALASGATHACALLGNGTVECWGDNEEGQLGNGTLNGSATPVAVIGVTGAIAVDVGRHFSCALLVSATVDCWGYNLFGELGNGTIGGQSPLAGPVGDLTDVIALASGDHHTCALSVTATVACWGWNLHGELGNGSASASGSPLAVAGLTGVTALTAEDFDSCALLVNSTMECWGYNGYGELGNDTTSDSPTPGPVSNLSGVTAMAMKTDAAFACALLVDGTVQCWGYDGFGELGQGSVTDDSVTPGAVIGLSSVTAITIGEYHSCALLANGTVDCWGLNEEGQLGNGTNIDSAIPVAATGVSRVSAITAADEQTCALLAGGTYQCW